MTSLVLSATFLAIIALLIWALARKARALGLLERTNQELLKRLQQTNKGNRIDEDVASLSDSDRRERLSKYTRK